MHGATGREEEGVVREEEMGRLNESDCEVGEIEEQEKEVESVCINSHLKKRYYWCYVGLAVVIITIIALQIGYRYQILRHRESQYQGNVEIMKQYRNWQLKSGKNAGEEKGSGNGLDLMRKHGENIEQLSVKSTHESVIHKSRVKGLQPFIAQGRDKELQEHSLRTNPSNPPTQPGKTAELDYLNYTGITVPQVENSLLWLQQKLQEPSSDRSTTISQREYYQQRYGISKYQQLPFCVVIPTFNNAQNNRHIKNINSVLMQEYSNYHIVFIDDGSTDSTSEDVVRIVMGQNKVERSRYMLMKNTEQQQKMYNLRMASNSFCEANEIFLVVDGDDQLIGRQVFKLFNAMFQKHKTWFVYSNFLTLSNYVGFSRPIPPQIIENNSYRQYSFVTSHLRAFYNQLFRNIQDQDLRNEYGEYFSSAVDMAICLPILEQAQERVHYVAQISYYMNANTGSTTHQLQGQEEKKNEKYLRQRPKYERLASLFGDNKLI